MNEGQPLPLKAHLLIVDDEANTLASLSRAFRLAGHEAAVCDNATKALELAKTERFDLILSDVFVPGKDGLTLLEELKSQGVTAPVVMMSGQAHIEMAVRATKLGALDFLEKPVSTDKLLLTVENALRLQRLESENRQLRQRLSPPTPSLARLTPLLGCSVWKRKAASFGSALASPKSSGPARR